MKPELTIDLTEIPLSDIMDYFVNRLEKSFKEKITNYEYFIDPTKNAVIFKLFFYKEPK